MSGGCVALFFSLFLVAGCAGFYWLFLKPALQGYQARNWQAVPCTILSSEVETHSTDDGNTYKVKISYQYFFNDEEYRSSRYEFMNVSTGGRSGKAKVVSRYPPGSEAICYVDPNNPSEAVIERGITAAAWFGLIPLVFVLVGGGGIYFSLRKKKPIDKRPVSQAANQSKWRRTTPVPIDPGQSGPITLKAKCTPVGKFIGITFVALFWNGIVSVFVFQVIKAWSKGGGSPIEKWFLPVFLIPFVLIGLVLIGAIFHSLLAIFNPRAKLTISSGSVALGEKLNLEWQVSGRTAKLTRLRIYLEGREEATYRRGTTHHTDKHVFKTIDIANLTSKSEIRSGLQQLTIPADSMHTFEAQNNKIIWSIHAKGEIPRWPDLDDEYPLTVLPARSAAA